MLAVVNAYSLFEEGEIPSILIQLMALLQNKKTSMKYYSTQCAEDYVSDAVRILVLQKKMGA